MGRERRSRNVCQKKRNLEKRREMKKKGEIFVRLSEK